MGLHENYRPATGVVHQGGYTRKFYNAFYCTKRFPWAIRGQKRKIAQKLFFSAAKNGGYTPGGYTRGVIHQALQVL